MLRPSDFTPTATATGYLYELIKNETAAGASDGTPIDALIVNNLWYAMLAVLDAASVTPSGSSEASDGSPSLTTDDGTNQLYFAIKKLVERILIDEGDMESDSADYAPTQQSVKAYVDNKVATSAMKYSGASVHTGAKPTTWTDLDLSTVVGANRAIVHLSIESDTSASARFRPKGITKAIGDGTGSNSLGVSGVYIASGNIGYITVTTDANGVVEWIAQSAGTSNPVKVVAYQVLA